MAAVAGSDIDSFIREQKAKLATERQALARDAAPPVRHLQNEDEEYRAVWSKLHPQKSPRTQTLPADSGASRRPGSAQPGHTQEAHQFHPRIQRKLSDMEYRDLWKEVHGDAKAVDGGRPEEKSRRRVVYNPQASVNVYEQQKKALQEQRKEETQAYLQQQKEEHHDRSQRRQWKEEERGKAIPDSEEVADAARRKMAEDRKKEYLEVKEKSEKKGERRRWEVPDTALDEKPLKLGDYERIHQQFQKERQQDYNKMLQSQKPGNRSWNEPKEEKLLPVGENEMRKKQLEQQRNQEYNEYLKSKDGGNRTWREPSAEKLLPLGDYEHKRRAIEEARKTEYQEFLRKTADRNQRRLWKEVSQEQLLLSDEPHVQKREKLKSERQQDYRQYLREQNTPRRNLAHQTDEYKANVSFPGMNESDNAKIQKERERNEVYNQHLREKGEGRRPEGTVSQQGPEYYATLPGMRDSSSAKKRKELQRNAEYNLYLQSKRLPAKTGDQVGPPVTPRRVWATPIPTYENLLDQKRQEEAQYRRTNDPSYDRPLEPARDRRNAAQGNPSSYYASLPLGADFTDYEKKRQQEQYRHDLERQIKEAADGKQREFQRDQPHAPNGLGHGEKTLDLNVDYSGFIDPEVRKFPAATITTGRRSRQNPVRPYHTTLMESLEKLDQISPRSEVILGRRRLEDFDRGARLGGPLPLNRGTPRGRGVGVIDTGFESLMDTPRLASIDPPPGLQYQPASYITQGGSGGLGQSSVDEAYSFYATRNPLEEASGGASGGDGVGVAGRRNRADQEVSFAGGGGGGGGGGRGARVRFEEEKRFGRGQPLDFPSDEDNKRANQAKAQAYQEELHRQIEENKRKKMKEREEKESYDRKIEQEAKDYNPYGRGGGGAPMRDSYGNLITDLRSMHRDNEDPDSSRRAPNPNPYISPRGPTNIRDDLFGPPPVQTTAEGEQSYARGGHGIFGMPKTDSEKIASEKYKSDLMRQIEEKKYEDMKKREREREEEAKEQRRVEEQQRRMQEEYEEERRRAREKEEEARRKNDELMRLAEERKREAELRKREAEEQRQEEQRREREAEEAARVNAQRGDSPPVPAIRTRTEPEPSTSKEDTAAPARAQSADVLNQLAAMRKQLQNERQRVENMLETERNEPDVFDPRLVQRPPPAPVVRPEIDVFETARNRTAAPVHRAPAERPSTQAVEDFSSLKFKDDSDSRKEFRRLFPEQPSTGDTLEAQQAALLRQQEDNLRRLREQRQYDMGYPKASVLPPPSRNQSLTPKKLHSDSAFVDVGSVNHFPDDFDDIPTSRRNDSARARRRDRRDSSPRVGTRSYADPFGSTTSLNVDRLSKKNEERLKRLRDLQGDDMSLYDPDDVLDRFMSKQAHNRPPSGNTLQDDTWLFPGSKASGY